MADNKEALPEPGLLATELAGHVLECYGYTADQMHAFREAGVSELRAEVERLRVDAERYRWLRELPNADSLNVRYMGSDLDMVIDSSMSAGRSEGRG